MERETEASMTQEIAELKMKQMQEDISEIKQQIKELPKEIASQLNESIELKMQVKMNDLEKRFYKWVTGLTISVIGCLVGLIIKFLMG